MWTGLLVNVLVVCEISNKILSQADPYTREGETRPLYGDKEKACLISPPLGLGAIPTLYREKASLSSPPLGLGAIPTLYTEKASLSCPPLGLGQADPYTRKKTCLSLRPLCQLEPKTKQ